MTYLALLLVRVDIAEIVLRELKSYGKDGV